MPLPPRVAAAAVLGLLLAGCASGDTTESSTGGDTPASTTSFDVPTYDWDGASAMEARVSGRLSFTDDGCTLLSFEGDELGRPVVFPDAVGIEFENGVRGVAHESSGEVFAVEGEEFAYAGGAVPADEDWTEPCGGDEFLAATYINDEPAHGPATEEPAPVTADLPDRVGTPEERGYYEVPTYPLGPDDPVMESFAMGTVTMTEDGCPVFAGGGGTTGIALPNATGRHTDDGDVVQWEIAGQGGRTTFDGDDRGFGGGPADEQEHADLYAQWARLCPADPVTEIWLGH
ncbi:MAG: hypothetical protein ACTHXO_07460 [Actinomycetaceae bacterium]